MPSEVEKKLDAYLPLGCLYLISALERAGYRVDFRDYQLYASKVSDPLSIDAFQDFLAGSAPIVGVSSMVSMLPFVLLGTKRYKENHPDQKIILGGPGPSGVAKAIMESMPWIDVIVRGEGEATLTDLMRAVTAGDGLSPIQGITYRTNGAVCENPPRPRVKNLDEVSLPAYHAVDLSRYDSVSIVTGRGCPFHCAFCDVGPLWGNRVYLRSVENVIAELDLLRNTYGRKRVSLADDTLTLQRSRTEALLREIEKLNLKWSCLSRVDTLDEDLLGKMARAGCDAVFFGIESGSNDVLAKIGKKFTIEEATQKIEMATKHMKKVVTSYIWGFPFETMDDFKRTIFSIVAMWHLGAMAGLKLLSPMPLSRLGIEYRDRIGFSEQLCSVFATLGNTAPGVTGKRAAIPAEFKVLIEQYPDIFEGFYYIKSDAIHEKARYLENFCEKFGIPV
jgi:anaerobic magnesium-protoporphyrin IX monomethyl ester cyclase